MGFIADAVNAGLLPAWAAAPSHGSPTDSSSTSKRSISRRRLRDPRLSGTRSRRKVPLARRRDGDDHEDHHENGHGHNENMLGDDEDDENENEHSNEKSKPNQPGGQHRQNINLNTHNQGPQNHHNGGQNGPDNNNPPDNVPDNNQKKQQEEQEEEEEGAEEETASPVAPETTETTEATEATETPEVPEGQEDPADTEGPETDDPDDPDDEGDETDDEGDDAVTTADATATTPTPTEQPTLAAEMTSTTDTDTPTTLSTTTSTTLTPTTTPVSPGDDTPDDKAGVIAGSIVGSLVVVALVFLGIVYYRRWNNLRRPQRSAQLHSSPEDGHGDDEEDRVPMTQTGGDQQAQQHVGLLPKAVGSGTNRTSDSSNPSASSGNRGNQPYPSPPYDYHPHDYDKIDLGGGDVAMQDAPPVANGNAKAGWMWDGSHYTPVSQQDPSPYHNSIVAGGGGGGSGGDDPGLGAQFPGQDITSTPYQSSSSDFSPQSQYMPYEAAGAAAAPAPFQPPLPQRGAPPLQPAAAADPSSHRISGPPVLPSVPEFSQDGNFTENNIFGPGPNNAAGQGQNGYPTTHMPTDGHSYNLSSSYNPNYTDTSDGSSGYGSSPYDSAGGFGPTPAYGYYQPFR